MATHGETTNEAIRVFCLNLRFGLADDGPNSWRHRKACYPVLFDRYPCDIYGFQEANDFQIIYLQELLPDYDVIGWRSPAPGYWQNNIIFHHRSWECIDSQHFYLSATPDVPSKFARSRWPRQCTMGRFKKGKRQIAVINTHFDFEAEVQHKSALLILERLNLFTPSDSAVIMGDLNAGPGSSCLTELTSRAAAFRNAAVGPIQGTHHGFTGIAEGPPIDWILYRGNIALNDAAIVTEQFEGRYPSDHFPLTASLKPLAI